MEVWPGKWVVTVRNIIRVPSSLTAAKQGAIDLYRSRKSRKSKEGNEWIKELNQTVANEIDRTHWTKEKRKWPVDLMGGHRHRAKKPRMSVESRQAILDAERILIDEDRPKTESPLKGDDIQLNYDADGYPKLPVCLDRRPQTCGGRMSGPAPSIPFARIRERRACQP
jgi:hypothetical protein